MKKLTKKLWVFVMLLSMAFSINAVASAATTTGLEDGLYEATTAPNPDVMNTFFKLSVVVEGGKVTTGSFELRVDGYPSAVTVALAQMAPTQEAKDFITNTCPEVEDYSTQLLDTGDGALVTKSSKAVDGSTVYDSFNELWKDVVGQAGGTIGETAATVTTTDSAASTDTAATSDVPKTGVVSFGAIFGIGAIVSAAGVAFNRKK